MSLMPPRRRRSRGEQKKGLAFEAFVKQETGLRRLLTASDLYTIHIMATLRKVAVDDEQVRKILTDNYTSGYAVLGDAYDVTERALLAEGGQLRSVGQQVLVATYTMVESYLINKFPEYLRWQLDGDYDRLAGPIEKSFARARSLKDIGAAYRKHLDISLPHFDVAHIVTTNDCSFSAPSAWEAPLKLSDARNEIVHAGEAKTLRVNMLTDARYPFEFARDWIGYVDCNFDYLLHDDFRTDLILQYEKRRLAAQQTAAKRAERFTKVPPVA